MRFLVDAQSPRRLARELAAAGHYVVYTLDLPRGNGTTDDELSAISAITNTAPFGRWTDDVVGQLGRSQDMTFTFTYP